MTYPRGWTARLTGWSGSRRRCWIFDGGRTRLCRWRLFLRGQRYHEGHRIRHPRRHGNRPDEMKGPIIPFTGFPPNSDKFEIKRYIADTVLPMLSQQHREEIDGEPFGSGRFRESIWFRLRAGERARQNMRCIINTLKAKGMEHEGRCIMVSPKLRGAQKKVQCTRAIEAAEALLPGALTGRSTSNMARCAVRWPPGSRSWWNKTMERLDVECRAARVLRL